MSNNSKQMVFNFNVIQTHNSHDCESVEVNGRQGMSRRNDLRIGNLITIFGQTPTGFKTVKTIVERMNRKYKSNYTYNDVYPTLRKMEKAGILTRDGGAWTLVPQARALYQGAIKNRRSGK